jgi:AcrR family transcriptional regulator
MGRPKGFNRDELLQKVGEVFWTKGYADTSISDIEKATGVAKSGIYSEFKDKDDLYISSLRYYMEHDGAIDELTALPLGWQNIENWFSDCSECQADKGCFLGNTIRENAIIPKAANDLVRGYFDKMKLGYQQNLEAAGFGASSKIVAEMILTFNLGLSLELNLWDAKKLQSKITEFLEQIQKMKLT